VVCSNTYSFSLLQDRFLIDSETTNQILSILCGVGIISFDGSSNQVLISDIDELERVLDILFEKFHDKE
jgi:hypothetical protein